MVAQDARASIVSVPSLLEVAVLLPTALVVVALFAVLWRERSSSHDGRVAVTSAIVLAAWAIGVTMLARQGAFQRVLGQVLPAVGANLIVVLVALAFFLGVSRSLRGLLSNRANLIRLHVWRLEGLVFLILMLQGSLPALWAVPAGLGDILVGATAPWIARGLDQPGGRQRAIAWTLFGMADLVVAVALGVMTNPGPGLVFDVVPNAGMLTQYPLALVPTFLVPLAFTLHVVSLLQLSRAGVGRQ